MANGDQKARGGLQIAVIADPRWLWRWHKWLIDALAARGHQVELCLGGTAPLGLGGLRHLLQLERLVYRLGGDNAADLIRPSAMVEIPLIGPVKPGSFDLVIDLAGGAKADDWCGRVVRPLYDGGVGDAAVLDCLFDRRAPKLALADSALGDPVQLGLCAIEQPEFLTRSLDSVFSRMAGSLLRYADDLATGAVVQLRSAGTAGGSGLRDALSLRTSRFLASSLAGKIANRLDKLARSGPRWGVGWRIAGDQAVRLGGGLDIDNYRRLADDGQRYYADPFVIRHGGLYHVFIEDYPFATQQGVISHFTVDDAGRASRPHMVLSRPYHLSYPYVFEHAGAFWMIPESSANASVELYRAARFPDVWVLEKVLIDNIRLEDVTPLQQNGRWWLFAGVSDWQSSRWDALGLYHAGDLMGEWQPHKRNPVLLDARAARPAGALFKRDGALWRPAQDCSTGYGAGLALCRVDRLDVEGFEQTVMHSYAPAGRDGFTGLHTLNEHEGLEVIDFFGRF